MQKKDKGGTPYISPGPKSAPAGARVTISTNSGPKPGTMGSGGRVIPDKRK